MDTLQESAFKGSKENKWSKLYKKPFGKSNYKFDDGETPQEFRRLEILAIQKCNRHEVFNLGRNILQGLCNLDEEGQYEQTKMDIVENAGSRRKFRIRNKNFAYIAMLSEWMLQVPEDFNESWILVPCPVGQRAVIVACKGKTMAYTRKGFLLGTFQSALPGGNSYSCRGNCTILDCIWLNQEKVYYVLDVIAWCNQSMTDCDAEFRLYWLQSHLNEINNIDKSIQDINKFPILTLPSIPCDSFPEYLQTLTLPFALDGLLFFHKEGFYTSGETPLVTWLKIYMVPELFSISLPEQFSEKPDGYIDLQHHASKIMKKQKHKTALEENMEQSPI